MIDINGFLQKYYPNCSEAAERDTRSFLAAVERQRGDTELSACLRDKQFLCKCMYMLQEKGLSATTYGKRKTCLANLCDFLHIADYELPLYDEVLASQNVEYLFADLDSLLKFVDDVGYAVIKRYDPSTDLMHIKGIAILGWYGGNIDDIAQAENKDLERDEQLYFVNIPTRGKTSIRRQDYEILSALSKIDQYHGMPSGRLQYLKPSNLLFRSIHEGTSRNRIVQLLKRFNQNVPTNCDSRLVFTYLYRNAKFVEIHNDKSEMPLIKKMVSHLGCPTNHAYMIRIQYALWVKRFFGETVC